MKISESELDENIKIMYKEVIENKTHCKTYR